jgi:hypothetical protein
VGRDACFARRSEDQFKPNSRPILTLRLPCVTLKWLGSSEADASKWKHEAPKASVVVENRMLGNQYQAQGKAKSVF